MEFQSKEEWAIYKGVEAAFPYKSEILEAIYSATYNAVRDHFKENKSS